MVPKEVFLIVAVSISFASSLDKFDSLRVGYDEYYHMPTSKDQQEKDYKDEFHYVGTDYHLNCTLYSYYDDPRVIILYDYYGYIAGIRTCVIQKDVAECNGKKHPYEFHKNPVYKSYNYWDTEVRCTDMLFLSPRALKAGGRKCDDKVTWEELWLKLPKNNYACFKNISRNQCEAEKQGFTEQKCHGGMGNHYFYNLTYKTECASHPYWFLLFESKGLIGLGLLWPVKTPQREKKWMYEPDVSKLKEIVDTYPTCLTEWGETCGLQAFYVFFKKHPRWTACIWPWQKGSDCK